MNLDLRLPQFSFFSPLLKSSQSRRRPPPAISKPYSPGPLMPRSPGRLRSLPIPKHTTAVRRSCRSYAETRQSRFEESRQGPTTTTLFPRTPSASSWASSATCAVSVPCPAAPALQRWSRRWKMEPATRSLGENIFYGLGISWHRRK
jgi:hypothetical protein